MVMLNVHWNDRVVAILCQIAGDLRMLTTPGVLRSLFTKRTSHPYA